MTRRHHGWTWWSEPTSTDEAHRRAAGRRKYNALRQLHARLRQAQILQLLEEYGGRLHPGVQAAIARRLGVSEATISRDVQAIWRAADGEGPRRCPLCGCGGHLAAAGRLERPDLDGLDGLDDLVAASQAALDDLLALSAPDPPPPDPEGVQP